MRRVCRALAFLLLLGPAACANVWGFADLTSEDRDAGPTPEASSQDSTAGSRDGASSFDTGSSAADAAPDASSGSGCNLANGSVCRGVCPGNAAPCGCLPDPSSQTSYCDVVGSGMQNATCTTDADCAPGYGCRTTMGMGLCSHWCKPSTTCPGGTSCRSFPTFTLGSAHYNYCY